MALTKEWVKERWQRAREYQSIYKNRFNENISVKEFYKNDNPLLQKYKKVKFTFELDYFSKNNDYEFFIPQDSIEVIMPFNNNNVNYISENIKDSISRIFKGNSYTWVRDKINIEVEDIRGVETEKLGYYEIDPKTLNNKSLYISKIPKNFIVGKGKNKSRAHKNSYDLNIWL